MVNQQLKVQEEYQKSVINAFSADYEDILDTLK